ncbi:MAG: hypothetical protein COA32_06760 [Fluviicola sp.]|nr:MAG: hypothetical protein COA32_06760 [Fluviicola sp.]
MNHCRTKTFEVLQAKQSQIETKLIRIFSKLNKLVLVLLLFVVSERGIAQEYIDIFKSDYTISLSNSFDSSATETHLQEMNGDLTLPIKVSDRFAFLTGITYENISASFDPNRRRESVTGLTLKLGANVKHNSKWSGTYMLLPKISSDLRKISNNDFQFGGAVLMKYSKLENFNYKFGVYANKELFGTFIVPILGFYYLDSSEKFEAKVLLPLSVDLNYSMTNSFQVGLNFKGQVRSYNLNSALGNEADRYLAKSTNDVYVYFQYGTQKGINFQLGFGRSVGRSYRVYDEKVSLGVPLAYFGDNREQLNAEFSDGWLVKASVFYRLQLEEKKGDKL